MCGDISNGEIFGTALNLEDVLCHKVVDQKYRLSLEEDYDRKNTSFLLRRKIRKLERLNLLFQFVQKLSLNLEYKSPEKCLTIVKILEDWKFNPRIEERGIGLNNAKYWRAVTKNYLEDICSGKIIPVCKLVPFEDKG